MFGMLTAVPAANGKDPSVYKSYEDLFADLNERMQNEGYKIVKARSHRGKVGGSDVPGNEMVRCDLVCDRGGRPYRCLATKHKTSTKKTDCPWKAKAVNRKLAGGWVLTLICDQHNHEPGTPEPPSPAASEHDADGEPDGNDANSVGPAGPQPDQETQAALAVAGVSQAVLRLTGDTFHAFKTEYRRMGKAERLAVLAQFQLRVAAIYAVENEDMQRQVRAEQQERRHRQVEENRRQSLAEKRRRPANDVLAAQAAAQAAIHHHQTTGGASQGGPVGGGVPSVNVNNNGATPQPGVSSSSANRRRAGVGGQGTSQGSQSDGTPHQTPQMSSQQQMQSQRPLMPNPQPQAQQPTGVDPNAYLHLDQFQVQVPQGGANPQSIAPVASFHHYTGPPRRGLRGRQAQS